MQEVTTILADKLVTGSIIALTSAIFVIYSTNTIYPTALFTDTHRQLSKIEKFVIQPCAQSLIASPFGLAIIA